MAIPADIKSIKNLFSDIKINGVNAVDFWTSWQLSTELKEKIDSYTIVRIDENDTWYDIAQAFYGERELWWLIPFYNEIEDPFSLFFGVGVPNKVTEIKVPNIESVGIILNAIREHLVEKERNA